MTFANPQSLGKVTIDVQALGIDMLTIVGHKYGAPKGVAAMYIREGIRFATSISLCGVVWHGGAVWHGVVWCGG